ncbi:hypothetical protein bcere0029_31650 [Bacillus cereus AH1272]|nr:hypothetical protein bcere0029_31650 [Bacillus cereus AH1272]
MPFYYLFKEMDMEMISLKVQRECSVDSKGQRFPSKQPFKNITK